MKEQEITYNKLENDKKLKLIEKQKITQKKIRTYYFSKQTK